MTLTRRIVLLLSGAGALAIAASCSSSKGGTTPTQINTLSKVAGDSQVGSAGAALGATLSVHVTDQNGAAVSGAVVSWAVTAGGGSVGSPTSATDATGTATITRTLGPAAGIQTTSASLAGATGSPIAFTSIAQIQGAFSIAAGTGGGQSDSVLSTLANPFQAAVHDHLGAPVAGVIVGFTVTTGAGLISQAADTSDALGQVSTVLTLSATAGAQTVRANVTGLVGSPVSFSATATAGQAAQIAKSAGDSQSGVTGSPLGLPHQVVITDAHGNVVSGVRIRWVAGIGGGSVSDTAPTSNGSGIASVTRTLGATLGSQTDTASATLTGSPIVFVSTADTVPHVAGVQVGPGISFAPTSVTIASGGTVTWTWATGSIAHGVQWLTAPGTLPTNSAVQSAGTYQVIFTTPGTYTYDCIVHGAAMSGTVIVR